MSLIQQIGQKWLLSFILHISDLSSPAVWTAPSTALKKTNTPKDLIMWINETLQALELKKKKKKLFKKRDEPEPEFPNMKVTNQQLAAN